MVGSIPLSTITETTSVVNTERLTYTARPGSYSGCHRSRAKSKSRNERIKVFDVVETFDCVITCGNGEVPEGRHHYECGHVVTGIAGIRGNGGVNEPEAVNPKWGDDKIELGAGRRSAPAAAGNEDCLGIGAAQTVVGSHVGVDGTDLRTM